MIDFQGTFELVSQAVGVVKHHVPPESWPNTSLWAAVALPVGLMLALWGGRLLRTAYVLGFMVLGGAAGVELAGVGQFDRMIGLALGAGLAALVGHLLFRMWLGMTAGLCGVLLVAVLGSSQLSAEIRKFEDQRLGTGAYILPEAVDAQTLGEGALVDYARELQVFFYEKNRGFLYRAGLAAGLAFLLGMALGVLLPRWTMIAGTALIGTLAVGAGSATLVSSRWPEVWQGMLENPGWTLGVLGLFLLISLLHQARRPARSAAAALPAAPAPA